MSSIVFHKEYPLGHGSFSLAKDMSWFSGDVVDLINKYKTNVFDTQVSNFV
jgi:hypothetical protein